MQTVKTTSQVNTPEHGRYFPGSLGPAEPLGPQQTTCTRILKGLKTVHEGHICAREEPGFPGDAFTFPGAPPSLGTLANEFSGISLST